MEWCTDDRDTFEKKYKNYIDNNDYIGASNYLKSFNVPKENIFQLQQMCRELETEGMRYNMAMRNPNIDQNLIQFNHDYKSGNALNDKPGVYSDFCNYIKQLTDSDGKIRIDIEGSLHKQYGFLGIDAFSEDQHLDDAVELFKTQLGITGDSMKSEQDLAKLGVHIKYNDTFGDAYDKGYGKYLEIDTDNARNVETVLKALQNTNTNHSLKSGNQPLDPNGGVGDYRWSFRGSYTANDQGLPTSIEGISNYTNSIDKQGISAYTTSTIGEKEIALNNILDLVDRSEEEYQKALGFEEDARITMPLEKLGMRTASIQHLEDLYDRGMVENSRYKNLKKRDEQAILDHIRSANYANYEVYANDPDESAGAGNVLKKLDEDTKANLRNVINENIKNGKDVVYQMGRRGDQLGLVIGLVDKNDIDNESDYHNYREIFVVDFTKGGSKYDDELYNDNRTIAAMDIGNLLVKHTPLDVSKSVDGDREWLEPVYDENGTNYDVIAHYTKSGKGEASVEYISKEEAQELRNKKVIIDKAVDYALRSNYDPYGNYSPNKNMDAQLERVVASAMYELFPSYMQAIANNKATGLDSSREEEFIKQESDELFMYIKNNINLLIQL